MSDDNSVPVYATGGIFEAKNEIIGIAPVPIEGGDTIFLCGMCGIVRVDRKGSTIYLGVHTNPKCSSYQKPDLELEPFPP